MLKIDDRKYSKDQSLNVFGFSNELKLQRENDMIVNN